MRPPRKEKHGGAKPRHHGGHGGKPRHGGSSSKLVASAGRRRGR
jgi:hypothetical protein